MPLYYYIIIIIAIICHYTAGSNQKLTSNKFCSAGHLNTRARMESGKATSSCHLLFLKLSFSEASGRFQTPRLQGVLKRHSWYPDCVWFALIAYHSNTDI